MNCTRSDGDGREAILWSSAHQGSGPKRLGFLPGGGRVEVREKKEVRIPFVAKFRGDRLRRPVDDAHGKSNAVHGSSGRGLWRQLHSERRSRKVTAMTSPMHLILC